MHLNVYFTKIQNHISYFTKINRHKRTFLSQIKSPTFPADRADDISHMRTKYIPGEGEDTSDKLLENNDNFSYIRIDRNV